MNFTLFELLLHTFLLHECNVNVLRRSATPSVGTSSLFCSKTATSPTTSDARKCCWKDFVGSVTINILHRKALCFTDRAGVQPGCTHARKLGLWPAAIRRPSLPFIDLHPSNSRNYMDYYPFTDTEGMEGWVGLLWLTHSRQFTCQPWIGKVRRPKSDVLTTELRRHPTTLHETFGLR